MKKRITRFLAMLLVMAMLVQLIPETAAAALSESSTAETISRSEVVEETVSTEEVTILTELTDRRTEYSKEYLLSSGLHMITMYGQPVHYEKDGKWEDIDNTLKAISLGTDNVYINTKGDWEVRFPQELSEDRSVSITKDGKTLSFYMAGEITAISTGTITSPLADVFDSADVNNTSALKESLSFRREKPAEKVKGQVVAVDRSAMKKEAEYEETVLDKISSKLRYEDVYGTTDIVYDIISNQIKESVVMEQYDANLYGYTYLLETEGLEPVLTEEREILLMDSQTDEVVMSMPAPYLVDDAGEYCYDVEITLEQSGEDYILSYHLPQQWLAEDERQWPIVLDPAVSTDVSRTNLEDQSVFSGYPDSIIEHYTGILQCGYRTEYGQSRFYIRYNELPALTSEDVIIRAVIRLYKAQNGNYAVPVEAHKVLGNWDEDTLTWNNMPSFADTAEDYAVANAEGYYYWNITDIVQSWYEDVNYGVMFKLSAVAEADQNVNSWKQFWSADYGTDALRPTLTIEFRDGNGLESYWDYTTVSAGRAGEGYVNNYTGTLTWTREDLGFDGNRMPVSIGHVYNSSESAKDTFGMGYGWRTNFNQLVYAWEENPTYYIWEDGDGTKHYFKNSATNTYQDEDGLELTLTTGGSGNRAFVITDKKGNESCFDANGRLVQMNNYQRNASSITITYTATSGNLLSTVTDGVGRKYAFAYSGGRLSQLSFYGKGTGVLTYVSYSYDTDGNLTQITDKDGESCIYSYNSHFMLSAKDIDSDKISFTYSTYTAGLQNRVIKIQETSGSAVGGTLELEYAHNQTTFTYKEGTEVKNIEIKQYNNFGNVVSVQDDEGRAQYAEYSINDEEEKSKATPEQRVNQLLLSSKLQNTVGNMLSDTGFEIWVDGDCWESFEDDTVCEFGSESLMGNSWLVMTKSTAGTTGGITSRMIEISAEKPVTFSAYVKTTASARIEIYDTDTETIVSSELLDASSTIYEDWTRLEVSYTAPSDADIRLRLVTEDAGTTYMDRVQLEYASAASRYNMVENGDFARSLDGISDWILSSGCTEGDGRTSIDKAAAYQLEGSVLAISGDPQTAKSASQTIEVHGNKGDCFVLAGWAKGDSVPLSNINGEETERKFSIRATFLNYGTPVSSETMDFNPDTDSSVSWQYVAKPIIAGATYDSIKIEILYNYNLNTVYFDGIQLYKEEFGNSYTYDEDGNVVSVQSLDGTNTLYTYDANGTDLLSITEQIGDSEHVTEFTYDSWHNILTATADDGTVYNFAYDSYGTNNLVTITKGGITMASAAVYSGDGNRPMDIADTAGWVTNYTYNENTNLLEAVRYPEDTETSRTEYTYGSMLDRVTSVSKEDDTTSLIVFYGYDGDKLSNITSGSTSYSLTYGPFGLTQKISASIKDLVTYNYSDYYSYLESVEYLNGDKIIYTVDDDGKLTAKTYEDGDIVTYEYDNNGALAVMKDSATGTATKYFYDLSGRMVKYTEDNGTDFHSVFYSYNDRNLLAGLDEKIAGNLRQTTYTYDEDGRITQVNNGYSASQRSYGYSDFGQLETKISIHDGTEVLKETYSYRMRTDTLITGQIQTLTHDALNYDATYSYTYDKNGNILSVSDGTYTTTYVYDIGNQLIRENNQKGGFTHVWTYDSGGNILSRSEYAYTTGELGNPEDIIYYTYGDNIWWDQLTAYDGTAITRDQNGNRLSDGIWTYTWEHGRQLSSITSGSTTWNYTYNADGMRTSRTDGILTYNYVYNGDQLSRMTVTAGSSIFKFDFIYDADGPMAMVVDEATTYYYVKNIQGDIMGLVDTEGNLVVEYTYDAWGRCVRIDGDHTIGTRNPLRYRGYVYDEEPRLYYVSSRYYDADIGRFINADDVSMLGANRDFTSFNLFAYCGNNPVIRKDASGYVWETVFDVVSLAFSIAEVAADPTDGWAWAGLVGDVVDVAVPFVGGVGEVIKAAKYVNKAAEVVDTVHDASKAIEVVDDTVDTVKTGWHVGDHITNLTKAGNTPSWSTVRQRYWKNEAFNYSSEYTEEALSLMKNGRAPIVDGFPLELHHPNGRVGDNFWDFYPVTRQEHHLIHYGW